MQISFNGPSVTTAPAGDRAGRAPLPLPPLAARRSRKDEVYERVREAILANELGAGTRLVPEEIARSMGVSRTPVVQALDRLAREGLLETLPNGRVVVAGASAEALRELIEIRLALEAFAGRLAAQRGLSLERLQRLRELNRGLETECALLPSASGSRREDIMLRLIALNRALHDEINAASGNRRLVRLLAESLDLAATQPVLLAINDEEFIQGVRQHAAVIDALAVGDADTVERALRQHVAAPLDGALSRITSRARRSGDSAHL